MTTLRDIAARAKVSTCTVSRILKGGKGLERFSAACGERVRRAARELGFTPNLVARSLRTGTTGIVAFAVNWAHAAGGNAFQAAMISACEAAARRLGSHLLVVGDGAGQSAARTALGLAARRLCDSIIIPGGGVSREDVAAILASSAQVSFFGALPDGVEVGAELDDPVGIELAVRHLATLGHRRLAWVGYDDRPTCRRRERFISACAASGLEGRQAGIPPHAVSGDEASIAHTRSALLNRRADFADCTALVCYNDLLALGAYAALSALNLQVPREISVVGFDNVHAATAMPSLTTIDHELPVLAEAALAALRSEPRRRLVTPRLVVRASTGPVPSWRRSP